MICLGVILGGFVSLLFLTVTHIHHYLEHQVAASISVEQYASWPNASDVLRLMFLQDYNTRIVVLGTTLLGCSAGMVGSFTLLRKRALMGDALSHATLPGICVAFLLATQLGYAGKSLPVLLLGATISGLIGVGTILALGKLTKLKEDTALGAILSIFFGAGMALLGVIQNMQAGHAAGLESFIYGKTASMGNQDISLITWAACITMTTCLIFFKELKLLCFDEQFAVSRGYPVLLLDILLMLMVVLITIVGLQAVGLVLMIALLVIPAAAARFWTERLGAMFLISGMIGAFSSMSGAGISALYVKLPSGPTIVLFCASCFLISMILGTESGLLGKTIRRLQLKRSMDRQHLLRGIYELAESEIPPDQPLDIYKKVSLVDLLALRSWSKSRLLVAIERAQTAQLIDYDGLMLNLTKRGAVEAQRLTHQHRLWELYLITYAEVAPGRVDREADSIEHVLEPEVILELEELLKRKSPGIISSPHKIEISGSGIVIPPQTIHPQGAS